MAKLTRKTLIQFGNSGPSSSFGQFGSKELGVPQTSQDPTVIQQLSPWVQGWQNAIVSGDKAAYLEDMNGWCFVHSYMMTYMFQMGIPEWDSGTTYYINSVVQDAAGNGQWFKSLQNNNLNHIPPAGASNAFWAWINPLTPTDGGLTNTKIPKASGTNPASLVNSNLSDNGTNVILAVPLKFPDNTVQSTAAATPVSTQSDVTSIRSFGTTFHNTSGRPIYVSVVVGSASNNTGGAIGYCDANLNPVLAISRTYCNNVSAFAGTLFFIVIPGYYYRVNGDNTGFLVKWIEWS